MPTPTKQGHWDMTCVNTHALVSTDWGMAYLFKGVPNLTYDYAGRHHACEEVCFCHHMTVLEHGTCVNRSAHAIT